MIGVIVSLLVGLVLFAGCIMLYSHRQSAARAIADGGYQASREADENYLNIFRWLTTLDHKEIGILYIFFATIAALWGGVDGMMIRTELLTPKANIWTAETYNALFTTHGATMLFFFVLPGFFGIANYFLPMMIGADDLAFPRLNLLGFWLLPPALLLVRAGLVSEIIGKFLGLIVPVHTIQYFFAVAPPGIGWTMYAPLSSTMPNPGIDFFLLGIHLSGIATTMTGINFIVTVFTERADDVSLGRLNVFTWSMLTTSALAFFAFSLLGAAVVMLLLDRNFGTSFYATNGGGPLLWQHLFWFWGHPEVYIIFLPATGLMSTILPKFSGRKLFGFKFIVYSTIAMGVMSFGVWAHHMFTTGLDPRILASFMIVSLAIAVPSAIKTFNWITTMWRGDIRLTAPMLYCIGGISLFIIGGITGIFLAAVPVDVMYQGTYYVVGHFHLILMGIIPFMQFAASYYYFPILTKRMYDQRLAKIQAVLMVTGSTITFSTLVLIGMMGLPRRYASYPPKFMPYQDIATFGAYMIGLSTILWLYIMISGYFTGDPVQDADVWELKETHQFTREWQQFERELAEERGIVSSPPAQTRPASVDDAGPAGQEDISQIRGAPTAGEDLSLIIRDIIIGAISGVLGTLALTVVLYIASLFGAFNFHVFEQVGALIDLHSILVGYLIFLIGSMSAWALIFVSIAEYLPGARRISSGVVFGLILLPGFLVGFAPHGQLHWPSSIGFVIAALIAHVAYGATVSGTFGLIHDYVDVDADFELPL